MTARHFWTSFAVLALGMMLMPLFAAVTP